MKDANTDPAKQKQSVIKKTIRNIKKQSEIKKNNQIFKKQSEMKKNNQK